MPVFPCVPNTSADGFHRLPALPAASCQLHRDRDRATVLTGQTGHHDPQLLLGLFAANQVADSDLLYHPELKQWASRCQPVKACSEVSWAMERVGTRAGMGGKIARSRKVGSRSLYDPCLDHPRRSVIPPRPGNTSPP
jgi:hypothetical protein